MKKQSLGRGLDSLIPGASGVNTNIKSSSSTSPASVDGLVLQSLPIRNIRPNSDQPRKIFSTESIEELADSISSRGLLQPIVVTPDSSRRGRYIIIAGERRYRACKHLGKTDIHAIVKDGVSESDHLELALIENIQRNDLTPLEVASAYANLMEKFSYTQAEVATIVGKNRSSVANTLRLLNLPASVQSALSAGKITTGHARCILSMESDGDKEAILKIILEDGSSVRATESLVAQMKSGALNLGKTKTVASVANAIRTISDSIIHHKDGGTLGDTSSPQSSGGGGVGVGDGGGGGGGGRLGDTSSPQSSVSGGGGVGDGDGGGGTLGNTSSPQSSVSVSDYDSVIRDIEVRMGCKASIISRKKGGVVQLKYLDNDDLVRIIDKLTDK